MKADWKMQTSSEILVINWTLCNAPSSVLRNLNPGLLHIEQVVGWLRYQPTDTTRKLLNQRLGTPKEFPKNLLPSLSRGNTKGIGSCMLIIHE